MANIVDDEGPKAVAVVTGGLSGIGHAVTALLSQRGMRVVTLDREPSASSEVPHEQVDVSQSDQVNQAFARIARSHGRIDHVAHCAGIDDPQVKQQRASARDQGIPLDVTSTLTDDAWRRMLTTNLDGTFHVVRAALVHMLPRSSGSIVVVSSSAALSPVPGYPHYSASKAAVNALAVSVAREVADRGIRINVVAPGVVDTPMTRRTPFPDDHRASRMGPAARPEQVAEVIGFLLSPAADHVTGTVVPVDGGG